MINRPLRRKPVEDDKIYLVNFSSGASTFIEETFPDSSEVAATLSNFSAVLPSADEVAEMYNFTIMEYLNEMQRNPVQVINLRVKQLVNYITTHTRQQVVAEKDLLVNYIGDPLYKRICQFANAIVNGKNPGNMMMFLGIVKWVKDKSFAALAQRNLEAIAKDEWASDGDTLTAQIIEFYHKTLKTVIKAIDETLPKDKQGILTK